MTYLSETQEDYLLDILEQVKANSVARIKDIAQKRHVSLPTAVSAIKTLAEKNIIKHEKYSYIQLTDYGLSIAQTLIERKRQILKFLVNTLGLNEDIALKDAHKLEHDLSDETLNMLMKLNEFLALNPHIKAEFDKFSKMEAKMTLNEVKVGESARIVKILDSPIKNKLLSMGAKPQTIVKVEKKAPLGDPIEVTLLGYHLTLRKDEAQNIVVEVQ